MIGDEHIAGNEKQNGCKSSIHVTAYHVSSQSTQSSSPSDRQYLPDQWPETIVRSFRACTTCPLVLHESHEKIQDRPPDQVVYQVPYTPHLPIQICREDTRDGWPYCNASFSDLKLREAEDRSHLNFHLLDCPTSSPGGYNFASSAIQFFSLPFFFSFFSPLSFPFSFLPLLLFILFSPVHRRPLFFRSTLQAWEKTAQMLDSYHNATAQIHHLKPAY